MRGRGWPLLGALLLGAAAQAAKPFPPSPRSYVYNEGVVSESGAARLSARLAAVERATGHQFVVALFQSLDGESLEDYSNKLFRAWRIGDAKRDDGLLLCVFLKDRRWRVEVGYGLEGTITDLEAGEIARDRAVPAFKAGDFDAGVESAVEGLAAKLEGSAAPPVPRPAPGTPPIEVASAILGALTVFFLFFWATFEMGFHWGVEGYSIGLRPLPDYRYPLRFLIILWLFVLFLLRLLMSSRSSSYGSGGGSWSDSGGGFSGGGGSSGGGGASGSW